MSLQQSGICCRRRLASGLLLLLLAAPALAGPAAGDRPPAAGHPAPGAEPGPAVPEQLSLREAIRLAMEHNASLSQAVTNVQNSHSRLLATAQRNHLTLEAGLSRTMATRGPAATRSTVGSLYDLEYGSGMTLSLGGTLPWLDSRREGGEAGLELTLPLLRGRGKTSQKRVAVDLATLAFAQDQLHYFSERQRLIEQVARAYFDALRARQRIDVQRRAVEISQKATDDAQKRLDAGLITEIDVTRAKIQLAGRRESLVNQEAAFRDAVDRLVLLLGLPVGAAPELTDPVAEAPAETGMDAALRRALAHRPELRLRMLQEEEAIIEQLVARDRKKPRADLTANLSALGLSFLTGGGLGRVLTSILGLRVSAPVNRVALREDEATAARNLVQLQRLRELDRQQIVEEVRSLYRARETARSNIELLTENLKVAQQSLHLAQRLIEEGLADNRNLLDAQSALTETESRLISARIDDYLTSVSLRRALGQDLLQHFGLPPVELALSSGNGLSTKDAVDTQRVEPRRTQRTQRKAQREKRP